MNRPLALSAAALMGLGFFFLQESSDEKAGALEQNQTTVRPNKSTPNFLDQQAAPASIAQDQAQLDDPSQLGIPVAIDFGQQTFAVTDGAIRLTDGEDLLPDQKDPHPSSAREKVVTFPQSLRSLVNELPEGEDLPTISVPLFDGEEVDVQLTRHSRMDDQNGAVVGVVDGVNHSRVVLGYSEGATSGTIQLGPNEIYSVFHLKGQDHRLVKVDVAQLPPCGGQLHCNNEAHNH